MPETAASAARALLVSLYPRDWRLRYGEELAALLAARRLSPSIVFDLLGGALDARLGPRLQLADNHGASDMNVRLLTCCASGGPKPTVRQSLFGAGLIILVTLLLTTASALLKQKFGPVPAVAAIEGCLFPAIALFSVNTLYLHHRSWRSQLFFVGFLMTVTYLIFLVAESI